MSLDAQMKNLYCTLLLTLIFIAGCTRVDNETVVEHALFEGGPTLGTEYLLPCNEMPEAVKESLPTWLAQFVGKSNEQAAEILGQRWSNIQSPVLVELRERLSEFQPRSIMVSDSESYLVILRKSHGDALFLPEPIANDLATDLANSIVENNQSLREFLQYFAGLRESKPGCAGDFVYDKKSIFADRFYADTTDQELWEDSTILYHGCTGDAVLINSDGKLVWNVFSEGKIKPLADSFDDFIRYYVDYRKGNWPLDSYGPN